MYCSNLFIIHSEVVFRDLMLVFGLVIWYVWFVSVVCIGSVMLHQVLMNSKLPVDVLGRIWELSDIDDDGFLDCDEFILV